MSSLQSIILRFLIRKTINWNKSLEELRKDLGRRGGKTNLPKNTELSQVFAGGVRAEWIVPMGAPKDKVIVYLHGGGYCLGIVSINRSFVAKLAKESGAKVLLIDYRLAPENPFPAAIEDTLTVYRWLLQEGILSENIIMVADSSGCGLGLATLITLRDNKEPLPAAQVFMSPTVDFTKTGESLQTRAKVDPFRYSDPFHIANHYVGNNEPTLPLISPLYAELHNLPPMLIHASDYDVFLSDSLRLAEKARRSGVNVSLKIWDKMWHNFHMSADLLPEARVALKEIYSYINDKFA